MPIAYDIDPAWSNPMVGELTTPYGARRHPVFGYTKKHTGVDLTPTDPSGEVRAAGPGVLVEVGDDLVVIDHGAGVETRYEHIDPARLKAGTKVRAGRELGTVTDGPGSDGRLHFEVRQDGVPVDPVEFLESKEIDLGVTRVSKIVREPLPEGQEPEEPEEEEEEPEIPAGTPGSGTGTVLGDLGSIEAPTGGPVSGQITTAVANIPNRTSAGGFASSMNLLSSVGADFILLNEVSSRSADTMRATAPGYDLYRDPVMTNELGGRSHSMTNVVMWRSDTWTLLDGGRIKYVDDDRGYLNGPFIWDRYATWVILQRDDGAIVPVISAHMMTNPEKTPRQHGNPPLSRVEQFSRGMDIVLNLIRALAAHGPVILGGDMNSHHEQGAWTAAAKMATLGYRYAKDSPGVMHIFYPPGTSLAGHRQVGVASDHDAIITTINMNGQVPQADTGTTGRPPVTTFPTAPAPARLLPDRLKLPAGSALDADQVENAAVIIDRGQEADLPPEAWAIAVAAALTDSGLANLDEGDRLGVYRQRPDAGTGDAEAIQDPEHAADAFYGVAEGVRNPGLTDIAWTEMGFGEAAATVQRSPFPDLYDDREAEARYIVEQLTGATFPGTDSCGEPAAGYCPPTPWTALERTLSTPAAGVLRCVQEAFPELTSYDARAGTSCTDEAGQNALDIGLPSAQGKPMSRRMQSLVRTLGSAVAGYLQDHADELDLDYMIWAGETWSPSERDAGWRPYQPRSGPTDDPRLLHFDRLHVALDGGAC